MVLEEYRKKRDFNLTPEPAPKRGRKSKRLKYVIQKHAARRLHYDFRLEMDGVLKSWAVPKGPSLDPGEKRLAVHVEDHPVAYASFEGVIPPKQYGAGNVIVWDEGSWLPENDPDAAYKKGHLKFQLQGEKLSGTWSLIRMAGRNNKDGKENWLLIKSNDDYADTDYDVTEQQPESILSGLTVEEIGNANPEKAPAKKATHKKKQSDKKTVSAFPHELKPQLATLVDEVPTGKDWLHEIKYDGYRFLIAINEGKAKLLTRNGKNWSSKLKPLAKTLAQLPVDNTWLDGELVVFRENGISDFQALQTAIKAQHFDAMHIMLFDVLHLDGESLLNQPLEERKHRLKTLLTSTDVAALRFCDHVVGGGEKFFAQACHHNLEGIISKRAQASYAQRRNKDWLKVKCINRQEFVIGGFTEPGGSRTGFGALLIGAYEGKKLIYRGRVGTGFNKSALKLLHTRLKKLQRKTSPFDSELSANELRPKVHWVKPELLAEVTYTEMTRDGRLRHPSYQGLREDKDSSEVVMEKPTPKTRKPKKAATPPPSVDMAEMEKAAKGISLTSPDKVLFPDQGATKLNLAEYYYAVTQWILPHIEKRPLTLLRCPQGRNKTCFFQKHPGQTLPSQLKRVTVHEKGKSAEYAVCNDLAGLLAMVQMGVLEIHLWGARVDKEDAPDRMIFDLDPDESLAWINVANAAQDLRQRLDDMGLMSFVKTTGGKGLHVVVPLDRYHDWDEMKAFSKAVADAMVFDDPKKYIATMSKQKRKGKIFIDYLRNGKGSTAIAPYSTRARQGATVALPIEWEELDNKNFDPKQWNIDTVPNRLVNTDDPWMEMTRVRQRISRDAKRKLGLK